MKTAICSGWEFAREWSEEFADFQSSAQSVELPHNPVELPGHYADHEAYQLVCGYRRRLTLPENLTGKKYFLQFDGAAHIASVYVNGKPAGEHRCGYTAFLLDITALAVPGENTVAVKLDTTENGSVPPFGNVIDYLTYGGLYREAWLIEKPVTYIRDITVTTPTLDSVEIRVDAENHGGDYQVVIRGDAGEVLAQTTSRKAKFTLKDLEARAWHPEDPYRYTCEITLVDGDRVGDRETVTFGFRTARFKADGFYLNGEKFFLRGLNRHQCFPYFGYAAPESLQREDARILKEELQCTVVRTSHYPQSQYFIEECDRLGLLVFTEIPGWQHIGDEAWKKQACINVEEMVKQYRNHPSVILWGVRINESQDDDAFYRETNRIAHKLDPSRATSGVRYLEKSHLLEDVYSYNDFSHTGQNAGCRPKKKVTPKTGKALMITEHNGHMFPTKSFDTWSRRQEHAMRHMNVLNAAYVSGEHAGCIGWCMFDYVTHKDFGSGDRVCYHGVMDTFRNPKPAAAAYASQGSGETVLEVTSSMDIGDYPGGEIGNVYVFSNAEKVNLYKNGIFVTELHRADMKGLPNAPFVVDDKIGELLESQEGFEKEIADRLRRELLEGGITGLNPQTLRKRLSRAWCLHKCHISKGRYAELYGKYVSNWGGSSICWRFDAIVNGQTVRSVTKCPSVGLNLEAVPSAQLLKMGDTYDMAAVRIRILDALGNTASYAQLPVTVTAEGPVQIVGPAVITAEGGMCGTYLRTVGEKGAAVLTLQAPGMEPVSVPFTVE